jgi:hypothetical protein
VLLSPNWGHVKFERRCEVHCARWHNVDASGKRERTNPPKADKQESDSNGYPFRSGSLLHTESHFGCFKGMAAGMGALLLQRRGESGRQGNQQSRQLSLGVFPVAVMKFSWR